MNLQAEVLEQRLYQPYGDVIAAGPMLPSVGANAGTARRFDRLAAIENLRVGAVPNLCVFRIEPATANPFSVRMLERHRDSTQVFIPMAGASRYLVVVCGGGNVPDLGTLKAFVVDGAQGISYRPDTWHHPLIALDRMTDFACLVYEDGSVGDCEESVLASLVSVAY